MLVSFWAFYLWILVMMMFPQLIKVTVSPSVKVSASAPSIKTFGPYHTGFIPTSAFWRQDVTHLTCLSMIETVIKNIYYGTDKFFRCVWLQFLLPWDVWRLLSSPPWPRKCRLERPASLVGQCILGLLGQWPIQGGRERGEKIIL